MLLGIYFITAWVTITYIQWTVGKANLFAEIGRLLGLHKINIDNDDTKDKINKFVNTGITSDYNITAWDFVKLGALLFVASEHIAFTDLKKADPEHSPTVLTHVVFGLIELLLFLFSMPKFQESLATIRQNSGAEI